MSTLTMKTVERYWSVLGAMLMFVAGLILAFVPLNTWRDNLRDLGGAIGGFWALSAGLLAYFATNYSVGKKLEQREREVAGICIAEIQAVWKQLADLTVTETLQRSTNKLREQKEPVNGLCYRGNVGDTWLCLQSSNPEAFGVLPHDLALSVSSHYSRLRNIIGRVNWMNGEKYGQDRYDEVVGRQDRTVAELRTLESETRQLLVELQKRAGIL